MLVCLCVWDRALKFLVLNGDFNADGTAWYDLDGSPTLPFVWDEAWVSGTQLEWLPDRKAQCDWGGMRVAGGTAGCL